MVSEPRGPRGLPEPSGPVPDLWMLVDASQSSPRRPPRPEQLQPLPRAERGDDFVERGVVGAVCIEVLVANAVARADDERGADLRHALA